MISRICIWLTTALLLAWICGCDHGSDPIMPEGRGESDTLDLVVDRPAYVSGKIPRYGEVIRFDWSSPEGRHPPTHIRYLAGKVTDTTGSYNPGFDIIGDLNENPQRYEDRWSRWIAYDAPGDSGTTAIIGDDEHLAINRLNIFVLQARGRLGALTTLFEEPKNVRRFFVSPQTGPLLSVFEITQPIFRFIGINFKPGSIEVPPGVPMRFRWSADASHYAGEVAGYRYAWDMIDFDTWSAPFLPENTITASTTLHAGVHTLVVETADLAGVVTRGMIEVAVAPFPMDRNLLLVDDFFTTNDTLPDLSMPPEADHDTFWVSLCLNAEGFDPALDVYDCGQHGFTAPPLDLVGRYKNIVWIYSNSNSSWEKIIFFVPESLADEINHKTGNYLIHYLMKGGHLWTCGRSDRAGGFAAMLQSDARSFPLDLACEITGNRSDCEGDRSGVNSFPYRDYCITAIDKIEGVLRAEEGMPTRRTDHYDVMIHAYRDDTDAVTALHADLPDRIVLRDEVTRPGAYFDPDSASTPGGFTYVEIYDPEYWLAFRRIEQQPCFHPIYRMRADSEWSAVDGAVVAVWSTKYQTVNPDVSSGVAVAAPSVHFGFPLWFFRKETADSIAVSVFNTWGIHAGGG